MSFVDGTLTTDRGTVYFTAYQEHLVDDILRGKGRLISLEYLIASLYERRDEPEWPEPTTKMHLSNVRKKMRSVGLRLVNVQNRGYRIERVER